MIPFRSMFEKCLEAWGFKFWLRRMGSGVMGGLSIYWGTLTNPANRCKMMQIGKGMAPNDTNHSRSATWNCWDLLNTSEYNATGGGGHCPYWSCRTICTWRGNAESQFCLKSIHILWAISGSCPIQHGCDTSSCTNSWTMQKLVFTTSDKASRVAMCGSSQFEPTDQAPAAPTPAAATCDTEAGQRKAMVTDCSGVRRSWTAYHTSFILIVHDTKLHWSVLHVLDANVRIRGRKRSSGNSATCQTQSSSRCSSPCSSSLGKVLWKGIKKNQKGSAIGRTSEVVWLQYHERRDVKYVKICESSYDIVVQVKINILKRQTMPMLWLMQAVGHTVWEIGRCGQERSH